MEKKTKLEKLKEQLELLDAEMLYNYRRGYNCEKTNDDYRDVKKKIEDEQAKLQ